MFTVESYPLAILLCVITMLCWGSWANTQKLASKEWRFQLFYWGVPRTQKRTFCDAMTKMRAGPSKPPFRGRLQTTHCCCVQKTWW